MTSLRALHLLRSLLAVGLLGLLGVAQAQSPRTIRLVVPFGAGAVQDTLARAISVELGQAMNATVVVENRAGAGGTIGTASVARAAPDGNTLILAGASHTLGGHLYSKLSYDPIKDFIGAGYLGEAGYVLLVSSQLGANTVADFVRIVKANPGKFNYASAGNGSATHLGMASLLARAGLKMEHVPTKSTGEAVNEVLSGRVQAMVSATIAVMPFRGDARAKLIGYTAQTRSKFLPEVPTVSEGGIPGFEFTSWVGVLAPSATPRPEIDRLHGAIQKVMADPAVQERFTRMGVESGTRSVDDFQKLLRVDWDRAGEIVRASGAKID